MAFSLRDLNLSDGPRDLSGSYIMALDCGTTSVRAVIVDEYGCIVEQAQRPLKMFHPKADWVEQDPMEILASQIAVMAEVQFRSGIHSDRIAAVGISNQRETTVVWDRTSGQPIYNAIGWQCRRTTPLVERIFADGKADRVRQRTGLTPDPYFSATKIKWILDNVEGAREAADEGQLMFGTIDAWLVYNLTGGEVYATDYTNASRTMLFNIRTLDWDDDLLRALGIPRSMMPEVRWSSGAFGSISREIMTHTPPIMGVAGDQQASLFGHCCFEPGQAKNTYGTGGFLLMNTGSEIVESAHGLVSTIGIAEDGKLSYALEGSIFHAGSIITWLRDGLGIIADSSEVERIARTAPADSGCYLVPAFSGLGAPWWDPTARGMLCGLTMSSDRASIVRAACESIAYQVHDVLRAMEADAGVKLESLSVDGGVSRNDFIMQFQSDLLGIPVVRAEAVETTALGAAYLAGLAVGYWEDREELEQNVGSAKVFWPSSDTDRVRRSLAGWHEAVERCSPKAAAARSDR